MKRKLIPLVALFTTLLGLAFAQKTEVSVLWIAGGPSDQALFEKFVKLYEQQNPNISLNPTYVAFPQLAQKLQLMIAGKTWPDVARVTTSTIADFAVLATDLTGTIDPAEFMPTQVPYIRSNKKVIAAPLDITVTALYYNKDCFADAGIKIPSNISLPWTLEEWKNAMVQVTQKSKCRYGLTWEPTTHRVSSLIYAAGGRYINTTGSKFVINSPESERALGFFQGLFKDNLIARGPWLAGEDATAIFKSGLSGMFVATNGHISLLASINNFKWGVLPMPMDKIRSTNPGGTFVMGFKDGKNPAEGAKFIKWFTSKEISTQYSKDFSSMSARRDVQDLKYGSFDDEYVIFRNDLKISPSVTGQDGANPAMAKINVFVREQIVKMLLDQQTPKQALDAIAAEGNKFLVKTP